MVPTRDQHSPVSEQRRQRKKAVFVHVRRRLPRTSCGVIKHCISDRTETGILASRDKNLAIGKQNRRLIPARRGHAACHTPLTCRWIVQFRSDNENRGRRLNHKLSSLSGDRARQNGG